MKRINKMKLIGITGGVGAGKSLVLQLLQKHCRCRVLLADEVGNEVKLPGQPCYERLVELLGKQLLPSCPNSSELYLQDWCFIRLCLSGTRCIHPFGLFLTVSAELLWITNCERIVGYLHAGNQLLLLGISLVRASGYIVSVHHYSAPFAYRCCSQVLHRSCFRHIQVSPFHQKPWTNQVCQSFHQVSSICV